MHGKVEKIRCVHHTTFRSEVQAGIGARQIILPIFFLPVFYALDFFDTKRLDICFFFWYTNHVISHMTSRSVNEKAFGGDSHVLFRDGNVTSDVSHTGISLNTLPLFYLTAPIPPKN